MRTAAFDDERARFALRFCCEECGHFDGARARCAHGWPTDLHRRARYASDADVCAGDERRADADVCAGDVVFCKEFELC